MFDQRGQNIHGKGWLQAGLALTTIAFQHTLTQGRIALLEERRCIRVQHFIQTAQPPQAPGQLFGNVAHRRALFGGVQA